MDGEPSVRGAGNDGCGGWRDRVEVDSECGASIQRLSMWGLLVRSMLMKGRVSPYSCVENRPTPVRFRRDYRIGARAADTEK